MKRCKTVVMLAIAVIALSGTAEAQVRLDQNFEDTGVFVNGVDLNTTGVGNSATTAGLWRSSNTTPGGHPDSTGQFLGTQSMWTMRNPGYNTGRFLGTWDNGITGGQFDVEFSVRKGSAGFPDPAGDYSGAGTQIIVGSSGAGAVADLSLAVGTETFGVGVSLRHNNEVRVADNGVAVLAVSALDTAGPFDGIKDGSTTSWHDFRFEIDLDAALYDVYLDTVLIYNDAVINMGFLSVSGGTFVNTFASNTYYVTSDRGPVWVDDVLVFCRLAGVVQAGHYILENDALKMVFDDSAGGYNCLSIENKLEGNTRFVEPTGAGLNWPGLWSMTFTTTTGSIAIVKTNGDSAIKSAQLLNGNTTLVLKWDDMDLAADTDALDVTATITLPAGNNPSTWTIEIVNTSATWGIESSRFPVLRTVSTAGTADVLLPYGAYGGTLRKNNTTNFVDKYPSGSPYCAFQFVAFNEGNAGLYIAAHDGQANVKNLSLAIDQHFMFEVLGENPLSAGSSTLPNIPFVVQAYSGDWWTAAKIYRNWGLQQTWASEGWLANRTNIPKNYMDIGYWAQENAFPDAWAAPDILIADMATLESTFDGLDLALHWYNWHHMTFDTDYPEFFPILDQGVDEDLEVFQAGGATVMPYINVLLWDQGLDSFESGGPGLATSFGTAHGEDAAVKTESGNYITLNAEEGHLWAPMCPYTAEYQDVIVDLCVRLIDPAELDVDGIYFDQLGGHRPDICYDPTHGHPLAGGSHWTDGYRTMLSRVTAAVGSNAYLTSEMFAEPYMDLVHGFLIGALYRNDNEVPLVQAVYSGYANTFGNWQSKCDTPRGWAMSQGGSFVWGVTPGWNKPRLLLEAGQETELALSVNTAKYRMAATEYLAYGELVGEVPITETAQITENIHSFYDEACGATIHSLTSRAAIGSIWRTVDGSNLGLVIMNLDTQPRTATFSIDVDDYLASTFNMIVSDITPTATTFVENLAGNGVVSKSFNLAANEIIILSITPAGPPPEACGDPGTVYLSVDKNQDCYVNLEDFGDFMLHWMWCTDPADNNCDQY